jgi:hypothetical protein
VSFALAGTVDRHWPCAIIASRFFAVYSLLIIFIWVDQFSIGRCSVGFCFEREKLTSFRLGLPLEETDN